MMLLGPVAFAFPEIGIPECVPCAFGKHEKCDRLLGLRCECHRKECRDGHRDPR
jgi:hypothetical protein